MLSDTQNESLSSKLQTHAEMSSSQSGSPSEEQGSFSILSHSVLYRDYEFRNKLRGEFSRKYFS